MISVRIVGLDEVVLRLDQFPKHLRDVLRSKFENIFSELTRQFFEDTPGRYLDPAQVQTGITDIGSTLVGYIEYTDKVGFYAIYPVNKPMLINLKQQFFAREVHRHPFPKGAPMIERLLAEAKPWIKDQLSDLDIRDL
jgi:hypothetical protein